MCPSEDLSRRLSSPNNFKIEMSTTQTTFLCQLSNAPLDQML